MADITVAMINDLRKQTSAGMMDCKKALKKTDGDFEAAIKVLRENGAVIQQKRANKESKQGIINAVASEDGKTLALAEVNTETDFVAKTDNFINFSLAVTNEVLAKGEDVSESMKEALMTIVSQTGENVKIRRTARMSLTSTGKVESYIHMGGKVGVLVEVACGKAKTESNEKFAQLVHDLTLQIAAAAPAYLVSDEVPADLIDAEKDIYRNQLKDENKPENIMENILKGKIKKFFSEICLVNQPFVKEPKMSITDVVNTCAKECDDTIEIKRYVRFQLGA
ncbi:MAG: translation elongation factor Ts [Kiritimatiellae bacterium]|jgi:elongation factor Ts|nr:translation elongation factor Ts [Kiritimatiellia bacterium]